MTDALALNLIDSETVSVSLIDGSIALTVEGLVGPVGPPGGNYRHVQVSPATDWDVVHNLGFRPSVSVEDSAGTVVEGDVIHVDANHLTISFSVALGGYANLS
jgi:hypothetical protein